MGSLVPGQLLEQLALADPGWRPILAAGLERVAAAHPEYLARLAADDYLPNAGRMFAAFAQPLDAVRYVLVGEGPYPRAQSAIGVCFMDGAVDALWSENGLSKPVNRATSLRNFMKMLLVANGMLSASDTGAAAIVAALGANASGQPTLVRTRAELQDNLLRQGFLLLNATPVYRKHVPAPQEARPWRHFLACVLEALAEHGERTPSALPTLVLWGKVAEVLAQMPASGAFPKVLAEHPYNLSFIDNPAMQALFGPMRLLELARSR